MDRRSRLTAFAAASTLALGLMACKPDLSAAEAVVGRPAPAFTLTDSNGNSHSLADYQGKHVVLEWINHGCPFVQKHYDSGNMQRLQKKYVEKDVVWLSIASSAEGKQGNLTPAEWNAVEKEKGAAPTALLIDADGKVGRLYGARTTPHMFVIDASGTLVYAGAIDDKPSTKQADIATAKNFVAAALDESMLGRPVTVASEEPYGCSVKY